MTRSGTAFAIGSALVLAALAGLCWMVSDLERREAAAQEATRSERAVGEALLRMDIVMMPLLAGEGARWPLAQRGMPLLLPPPPEHAFVRRYFCVAEPTAAPKAGTDTAEDAPTAALPIETLRRAASVATGDTFANTVPTQTADTQTYDGRAQVQANFALGNYNSNRMPMQELPGQFQAAFAPAADGAAPTRLYFVRHPSQHDERLQCIEVDWPVLASWLLDQILDVLPNARLRPCIAADTARRLASLPAALEPGPLPRAPAAARNLPLYVVLAVVWIVVLGALVAAGLALHAANALAARRALFVSSVTHELRTPLTTFRMYADMLASGMVPDTARADYYSTLRTESDRLTRIVESVLLYARLEDGRGGAHGVTLAAADLVGRILPLLRQRCTDGNRELRLTPTDLGAATLHVDPQAVEQILHNLVDNACKYATPGPLHVATRIAAGHLECDVRDGGPGIPDGDAAMLFRPFQRGEAHRGGTTPGLGLGLSIARGLAAALGGELTLHATGPSGTTFRLRLPLADSR